MTDPTQPETPAEPPAVPSVEAHAPRALGLAGAITRAFIASPLTPLFLMAAASFGIIALIALPREEEPQISVPMVDILVRADGLKAQDAAKLVTEPLETIVRGIDGVEHVYSQTRDDRVMVTARFLVGTDTDTAILRVHEKVRANLDRIPVGIPEPLIVGRGINDVAVATLTLTPADGSRRHHARRPDPGRPRDCRSRWRRSTMSGSATSPARPRPGCGWRRGWTGWRFTASPCNSLPARWPRPTVPSPPAWSATTGRRSNWSPARR